MKKRTFGWYMLNFFSKNINVTLKKLHFYIKKKKMEPFFSNQVTARQESSLFNEVNLDSGVFFFFKIDFDSMKLLDYRGFINFLPEINVKLQFSPTTNKPYFLDQHEVDSFIGKKVLRTGQKPVFEVGSTVTISKGPFSNLKASVHKINRAKKKLEVNVSIFGRLTPVELEYNQVKNLK